MTIQEIQELRAKRLSIAIEKSGLSYPELEKLTGIPKSSLQRYATGATKKIPIDYMEKMADALNIDAKYLTFGENEEKPAPTEDENELLKVVKELDTEYQFTDSQISRIASYMRFVGNEDSGEE